MVSSVCEIGRYLKLEGENNIWKHVILLWYISQAISATCGRGLFPQSKGTPQGYSV